MFSFFFLPDCYLQSMLTVCVGWWWAMQLGPAGSAMPTLPVVPLHLCLQHLVPRPQIGRTEHLDPESSSPVVLHGQGKVIPGHKGGNKEDQVKKWFHSTTDCKEAISPYHHLIYLLLKVIKVIWSYKRKKIIWGICRQKCPRKELNLSHTASLF